MKWHYSIVSVLMMMLFFPVSCQDTDRKKAHADRKSYVFSDLGIKNIELEKARSVDDSILLKGRFLKMDSSGKVVVKVDGHSLHLATNEKAALDFRENSLPVLYGTVIENTGNSRTRYLRIALDMQVHNYAAVLKRLGHIPCMVRLVYPIVSISQKSLITLGRAHFVVQYRSPTDVSIRPVELIRIEDRTAYIRTGLSRDAWVISRNQLPVFRALTD